MAGTYLLLCEHVRRGEPMPGVIDAPCPVPIRRAIEDRHRFAELADRGLLALILPDTFWNMQLTRQKHGDDNRMRRRI